MRSSKVNPGGTAFAKQYNDLRSDAFASSQLLAHEQPTPDLTLKVESGVAYIGTKKIDFAGGNSPIFTAPTTNPRIDLLTIDETGTLAIIQGTEALSPSPPPYPTDKLVICEVFNRVGQTSIRDTDTPGEGYIRSDVRPVVFFIPSRAITTGWDLISSGTFTSDITINNLNGDADKVWLLIIRERGGDITDIRFNGDTGTNYRLLEKSFRLKSDDTEDTFVRTASNSAIVIRLIGGSNENVIIHCLIHAKSGHERPVLSDAIGYNTTGTIPFTTIERYFTASTWKNTINNITSINIILGGGAGTITEGEFYLFKPKTT